jgi:hypothetical protein
VDSPAYLLAAAELATLQPEPIPSSKLSPREPTWASATVTRLRTEMDFRSGLEIVTGYDILFEEQATVTLGSFEGGQWAYGEINVCPHRLRSPSTLPTAADRAIAAVGSGGGAAVRTRVTRGSAAAGSALPGTTVKKEGISASKNTGRYSSTPLQMRLNFTPLCRNCIRWLLITATTVLTWELLGTPFVMHPGASRYATRLLIEAALSSTLLLRLPVCLSQGELYGRYRGADSVVRNSQVPSGASSHCHGLPHFSYAQRLFKEGGFERVQQERSGRRLPLFSSKAPRYSVRLETGERRAA